MSIIGAHYVHHVRTPRHCARCEQAIERDSIDVFGRDGPGERPRSLSLHPRCTAGLSHHGQLDDAQISAGLC